MQPIRVLNFQDALHGNQAGNFLSCYYDYCHETFGFLPASLNKEIERGFVMWLGQMFDEVVDLPGEEWRPVKWDVDRYMVSNMGRVKYKQKTRHRYARIRLCSKQKRDRGRIRVVLEDKYGKQRYRDVQNLVWRAFRGDYNVNEYRIRFKDMNRENCTLDNLELYDIKERIKSINPHFTNNPKA